MSRANLSATRCSSRPNPTKAAAAAEGQDGEASAAPRDEGRPGDWLSDDMETSRSAIEDRLGNPARQCFSRRRPGRRPRTAAPDAGTGYSEWATVGAGGRDDADHNLEAYVATEVTLADHLAGQLALATADPVQQIIGRHLIDLVDEAGYLTADLGEIAERLGCRS